MEDYYIGVDSREISAGVIIFNPAGEILACHCTGRAFKPGTYDLPKGHIDNGEEPVEAALREVEEETGLKLKKEQLHDLGIHAYTKEKNLYLFEAKLDKDIDTKSLKCTTYFTRGEKEYPEVNFYKFVPPTVQGIEDYYKSIQTVLKQVLELK